MTDISTIAPIAARRFAWPLPRMSRLGVGRSLAGISRLLGDAFQMAYVAPYSSHHRPRQVVAEDDLEGRDPAW